MPLKLSSSGGGSVTLDTPSTASAYTVTIPAATGTMVTTTAAQTVQFAAGTASAPSITVTGDTNTGIFFPAADTAAITTGGTERVRIDSSGNLLVGTTGTTKSGFNGSQLFFDTGTNGTALNVSRSNTSASTDGLITAFSNWSTTEEKFIVRANGDVQNRTGSYTAYSDERLKENITDARSYLDDLTKLRVVNYFFKNDTIKTKYLGFVAQEVEKVIPGLVFETENDGFTDCKGVKLTVMIPMLVQAVQELKSALDAANARIAALEAK